MEPHVDATQDAGAVIPTAGQTVVRTLPACAVALIGIPLMAWLLPQDAAEPRTPWELLIVFAALGLLVIVHYFAQAPRPRLDKKVGRAQWKRALASASRSDSLPPHPDVRIAAGIVACNIIEGFMVMLAVLLGIIVGGFLRPELSWLAISGGVVGGLIVYAFRLRRGWSYLRILHAEVQAHR